jgi:hypothetical protein
MFGVVDRALFLKYTNRNSKIRWETKLGGTPEEKPAVYRKANVPPEVELIKTPLLILHGEKDPQVPTQESAGFAEALKKAGKTYLYFTYPNCAAKGYSRSGELEQRRVKPGKKDGRPTTALNSGAGGKGTGSRVPQEAAPKTLPLCRRRALAAAFPAARTTHKLTPRQALQEPPRE